MEVPLPSETVEVIDRQIAPYRVVSRIGVGGVGEVYIAEDPENKQTVAVKQLKADVDDPLLFQRFRLEYDLLSRLDHPSVARVYTFYEGQRPFFTMEHILGQNFKDAFFERFATGVKNTEALQQLIKPVYQLLEVLEYLHVNKVIHRDLKPENVMVQQDGSLKLLDFGVSRFLENDLQLTQNYEVIGTVEYMAPEMFSDQAYDHRIDLYSLGVMLYRVFTGRRLFDVYSFLDVFKAKLHQESPLIDEEEWDNFFWFPQCINRLTQRRPESRFRSAREALEIFDRHLNLSETVRMTRVGIGASPLLTVRSAPLIGRGEELARVESWLAGDHAVPLLIYGASGTGKTRLANELVARCRQRAVDALVLDGGGIEPSAESFLMEVLLRLSQFKTSEDPMAAAAVMTHESDESMASRFMTRLSKMVDGTPVVVVDDFHLLPNHMLREVMQYFLLAREMLSGPPARWIFVYNDEYAGNLDLGQGGGLAEMLPLSEEVALRPMSREAVTALASHLLEGHDLGERLIDELHDFSGGLPLSVANLLSVLVDNKLIEFEAGKWQLISKEYEAEAPTGAVGRDLLVRQLESLSQPATGILQLMSACGSKSSLELIKTAAHMDRDAFNHGLNDLILGELVFVDGDLLCFSNPAAQRLLYEGTGTQERMRLHHRVLLTMERVAPKSEIRYLLEQLRHAMLSQDAPRVFKYSKDIGVFFFDQGMFEEAQQYLGNAISSYEGDPRLTLFEAFLWKAESELCLDRLVEAAADYQEALNALNQVPFTHVQDPETHRSLFERVVLLKLAQTDLRRQRIKPAMTYLDQVARIHEQLEGKPRRDLPQRTHVRIIQNVWSGRVLPSRADNFEVLQFMRLCFDTLLEAEVSGSYVGRLAKAWHWNEQTRTLTFDLRKNAHYHNGALLRLDDVVFSIHMIQEQPYFNPMLAPHAKRLKSAQVNAFNQVEVSYHEGPPPSMFLWANLPIIPGYVYSHQMDDPGISEDRLMMGSGPYVLESMSEQTRRLKKVPAESGPENITVTYQTQGILNAMIKKEAHLALLDHKSWTELSPLMQIKHGLVRDFYVSNQVLRLCFKLQGDHVLPLNLRRALYDCLLLENWNSIYLNHTYVVVRNTPLITQSQVGTYTVFARSHRALNRVLESLGYQRDGKGFWHRDGEPFSIGLLVPKMPAMESFFAAMLQHWARLGIKIRLATVPLGELGFYVDRPNVDAWLDFVFPEPDYSNLVDYLHSSSIENGGNLVGYQSKDMDSLLEQLLRVERYMRKPLKLRIDALFQADLPWMPLLQPKVFYAHQAMLGGVIPTGKGLFPSQSDYSRLRFL